MARKVTISVPNRKVVVKIPQVVTVAASATGDVAADDVAPLTGDIVTFTPSWTAITPSNWTIDFGDGTVRSYTGATATHKYRNPGTYTIKLWAGSSSIGIPVKIKTNYITASILDLTAFGTMAVWLDFQDEDSYTMGAGTNVQEYIDKATGVLWRRGLPLVDADINLRTDTDQYGDYKFLRFRESALDPTGLAYGANNQHLEMDNAAADQVVVDVANEQAHIFVMLRLMSGMYGTATSWRILDCQTENVYYRLGGGERNYSFRTDTTNVVQLMASGHAWRYGIWALHELQIDNGKVEMWYDGTLWHTQTGVTGTWRFDRIEDDSAQAYLLDEAGMAIYTGGLLSGANLTTVRNHFLAKAEDYHEM